ncbi:MAG: galactokinase family protein [Clostridia bacterium]|nr:galactokinase family protein [Clostridia bacterium]
MYTVTDKKLAEVYPGFDRNQGFYRERIERVCEGFRQTFGGDSPRIFTAPGRTEVGGNHTDHQHGCVLAAAVDLDILAAAAENGTNTIRILSEGYELEEISLDILKPQKEELNTSAALVRGTAAKLTEMGFTVRGFDAYMISNVLKGSGLSSSAAFEVIIGGIMNALFCEGKIDAVKIAQIGQYAENVFFGKPSGLMDQTASSVGGVVAIDFKDTENPVVRKLDFDFAKTGYSLCIIDSGADHADLTDEYAAIPSEMKRAAGAVGKEFLRETSLDEIMDNICEVRKAAGDRGVLRTLHFLRDNERAVKEAELLEKGDFEGFLETVKESGRSSFMYLQNVTVCGSSTHQEVAFALAMCDVLLGDRGAYRVHGGGFAGTVQAFVPNDMLDSFKNGIEKTVGKGSCHVLSIRNVGGAELTEGE